MGRCWTQSQRTPVHYHAGETRAVGQRLGAARSEVGTVCVSSASTADPPSRPCLAPQNVLANGLPFADTPPILADLLVLPTGGTSQEDAGLLHTARR
jgi:hypothetical protein